MRFSHHASPVQSALALAVSLACASAAHGVVTFSSSGATGSTALQIPSVLPASTWVMAYDPSTDPALITATASKGLYTRAEGITSATNMTWANTAGGGIQLLLPHTAGSNAVLGLGALNTQALFNPANVDGSTLGIDSISVSLGARQTSTPNDKGQVAPLLTQNGKYYRAAWTTIVGPTTPPVGSPNVIYNNLRATDFGEITISRLGTDGGTTNFGSNPNFSPSGLPIMLGWLAGYDSSLGTTDANNRSVVNQFTVSLTGVTNPGLLGDFDKDGDLDATDIDMLFAAVQGPIPPALSLYDVNADNAVNSVPNTPGSDIDTWVRTLKSTEYGDANLDSRVNFDDLLILASNYNTSASKWADGNFNGQGGVNFDDLLLLAANYNFGPAGGSEWASARAAVPEPATSALLVTVAAASLRRARRLGAKTRRT